MQNQRENGKSNEKLGSEI